MLSRTGGSGYVPFCCRAPTSQLFNSIFSASIDQTSTSETSVFCVVLWFGLCVHREPQNLDTANFVRTAVYLVKQSCFSMTVEGQLQALEPHERTPGSSSADSHRADVSRPILHEHSASEINALLDFLVCLWRRL